MSRRLIDDLKERLNQLHQDGLYKTEKALHSPQDAVVQVASGKARINLCANNYLGLANHPSLIEAAKNGLDHRGFGVASVRFICGTQDLHQQLEQRLSRFLGTEDTLLYSSCFDANGGLFETLLGEEDAIISDVLNHASIIDGIRLSKAHRLRYANNDMAELEQRLDACRYARYRLIATDGVFSMDGVVADLPKICDLAEKYDALVMVDDCHAVGLLGKNGRGSHEHHGVMQRIDLLTGTLGKALGGASGGYTSGHATLIEWLRQRSRPYLFSNAVAPPIVAASLTALDLLEDSCDLRTRLHDNSRYFRQQMTAAGFTLTGADHPIIPVMVGDAALCGRVAEALLEEGIYVVGFSYPVVPHGQARIRTQMSAAHTPAQLDQAIEAFIRVGQKFGLISGEPS